MRDKSLAIAEDTPSIIVSIVTEKLLKLSLF